ncbi:hypothetical protein QO002_004195 [Pararhizobium capsulatum DSM 1112]|uniref:FAD assembly factor SdhE n=1 Tax=Pararhizobium capsulatum DSM 1112 TaxID=1121113 RepID=A0ABU0BUR2_9HYPH|nr:hypothetical protein [Pararhizobium capsulatum]MDQ0321989.1 hypothetical protein [Pararhizobium capsulatum DSM 1112]
MGALRYFLRLSARRNDLEDRLLALEYRRLLLDDFADDLAEDDLRGALGDVSSEIRFAKRRHRNR